MCGRNPKDTCSQVRLSGRDLGMLIVLEDEMVKQMPS